MPQAGGIVAIRAVPHQAARHPCALEPVVCSCKFNYYCFEKDILDFFQEKKTRLEQQAGSEQSEQQVLRGTERQKLKQIYLNSTICKTLVYTRF